MIFLGTAALVLGFAPQENEWAIRVRRVLPVEGAPITDGVIRVQGERIVGVARAAGDEQGVEDLGALWAVPGMIDLHCHIGGGPRWDINDMVYLTNPGLGTLPTVDANCEELRRAVAGGVTTVLYIPGSGTNISGFGTLMKTGGAPTIEGLLVRYPGCLKIAQAWNPERGAGDLGAGRMGMWWQLRDQLGKARDYHEAWARFESGETAIRPEFHPDLEAMRGLFRHEFPVLVHTADARDVVATSRIIRQEFDLWTIVSHAEFGGYKAARVLAERDLFVNIGPRLFDFSYFVWDGELVGIPSAYYEGGNVRLSLNTDAPVMPEEELPTQGSMAVRLGLPEEVALRGLTIEPAIAVGIADRCGSLQADKEADIVLWTGSPLDPRSGVERVYIRGRLVYDAKRDGRRF